MIYRDIDRKIGYMFTISMVQSHPLIPLIVKEFNEVSLHFDWTGGEAYIDLFIEGEKASHLESIANAYDHVMRGNLLTVKLKSRELGVVSDIMDKILDIRTVIPASLYLKESKIRAEYRFHASELDRVTALVGEILSTKTGIEIMTLGPDQGGIHALERINRRIPLSFVSFETDMPADIGTSGVGEAFFEVNYAHSDRGMLRTIAMPQSSNVPETWRPISRESGLYLAEVASPFVNQVRNDANEAHIPRAATIMKLNGDRLRAFAFLPRSLLQEYLELLYVASRKVPDSYFRLSSVGDLSPEIWDWI